jgi:hypothetical protein
MEGDTFGSRIISSIQAYFGKRRGSGSGQVADIRELQLTFFEISDIQGFPAKMASFRAWKMTLTDPIELPIVFFMGWRMGRGKECLFLGMPVLGTWFVNNGTG